MSEDNATLEPSMSALAPRPTHAESARLDAPQRLGIVPTSAFWKRPDVWRIAGLPTGVFVFFWLLGLDLFLSASIPLWASGLLGGLGPLLFVGLLERYLRRRMQQRRALGPAADGDP